MNNEQLPPANIEAEEAILGGILLDPMAMSRVEADLKIEAFSLYSHQEIYRAALTLYRQMKPTDLMAVSTYLCDRAAPNQCRDRNLLEQVGGTAKLAQLVNRTVSAVNIDRYTKLVMDKYVRRQLIFSGHEIVELGYDNVTDLEDVLNDSQKKVFAVCELKMNSQTDSTAEISIECFNDLESDNPIYETGLYDLDDLMVGFEPGTLSILAGRPSMGKSAISTFFTLQMATKHQLPAIYFSLEMTKKQLQYRLWSLISQFHCYRHLNLTQIRGDRIRKHRAGRINLTQPEMEAISRSEALRGLLKAGAERSP
ncbi:MAG: DnaB-like helicase N-terminal domain-containing protein [Xenococcaceae cyanobacterium MO_234.B1]|nr:DnaB-like helicase N-terminal domain-containing protein [Xenococcaceae cyanobacterium MO_234.B1]